MFEQPRIDRRRARGVVVSPEKPLEFHRRNAEHRSPVTAMLGEASGRRGLRNRGDSGNHLGVIGTVSGHPHFTLSYMPISVIQAEGYVDPTPAFGSRSSHGTHGTTALATPT